MIGDWKQYIKTKEDYDAIVGTGYAWEFMPSMPLDWKSCKEELEKEKEKSE